MSGRVRIASWIVVPIVAAALFWLTLSATTAQVLGKRQGPIARSWQQSNSDALAASAWELLQVRDRRPDLGEARALALAALRREPGNVVAIRTLGVVSAAQRQTERANRLFLYSEWLSRRDLPTQLWMIEKEVAENDIQGALVHYDRALKTSTAAREILIPVLVRASAERAVALELGRMMARRPEWWSAAIGPIVGGMPNPATLPVFLGQLHLDLDDEAERAVLIHALRRLVDTGQFSAASRLYGQASRSSRQLVRNGDFDPDRGLQPFDWDLQDDGGLGARIEPREGGNPALFLVAATERSGQVARQLITLAPGRYQLTALVGSVAGEASERPQLSLHCAARSGSGFAAPVADLRFPAAPAGGRRVTLRFEVPGRDCPAQWITLEVSSGLDPAGAEAWIDRIGLQRL